MLGPCKGSSRAHEIDLSEVDCGSCSVAHCTGLPSPGRAASRGRMESCSDIVPDGRGEVGASSDRMESCCDKVPGRGSAFGTPVVSSNDGGGFDVVLMSSTAGPALCAVPDAS